jgi:hypothetical protein
MNNNASFGYEQYAQWAEESKTAPLPRKQIDLGGKKIEVFALPGYKEHAGRYIYSGTSGTEVVNKARNALLQFVRSKSPIALPYKDFALLQFVVENSVATILGCPSQLISSFWVYQLSKGNQSAIPLVTALTSTSLDLLADTEYGVDRKLIEIKRLAQSRFYASSPEEYIQHFFPSFYDELYRVFQLSKKKRGRPPIFARVTRLCFYSLLPGNANEAFDKNNPTREFYNHQFLTADGNTAFNQAMTSFLTFLRGCQPGNWQSFLVQYQNVYGTGFQRVIDLEM